MSGDFNPSNVLARVCHEAAAGIMAASPAWKDFDLVSETMASQFDTIKRKSITAAGQEPEPGPGKITGSGGIQIELNAEAHMLFALNVQGSVYSHTNIATGVEQLKFAPSETSATAGKTLAVEMSRDDDMPQLFNTARVSDMVFNLGPSQYLETALTLMWERHSYFSDPTVTAGTPTTKPQIRGILNYTAWTNATASERRLYMKITDASGAPTSVVAKFKQGAVATYGSTTVTIPAATWTKAYDSTSGRPSGTDDIHLEVYFADFTGGATNDEYYWDSERAVWTPTYPDVQPFNEIYATITIDGVEEPIDGFQMGIARPVQAPLKIGGRFPYVTRLRGRRAVTGTLSKEYLDARQRKRLERGQPFELKAVMRNGVYIGSTNYQHQLTLVSGRCLYNGKTATVTSETEMKESLPYTSHPDPTDGNGNVDDATMYFQTSIADPTA